MLNPSLLQLYQQWDFDNTGSSLVNRQHVQIWRGCQDDGGDHLCPGRKDKGKHKAGGGFCLFQLAIVWNWVQDSLKLGLLQRNYCILEMDTYSVMPSSLDCFKRGLNNSMKVKSICGYSPWPSYRPPCLGTLCLWILVLWRQYWGGGELPFWVVFWVHLVGKCNILAWMNPWSYIQHGFYVLK